MGKWDPSGSVLIYQPVIMLQVPWFFALFQTCIFQVPGAGKLASEIYAIDELGGVSLGIFPFTRETYGVIVVKPPRSSSDSSDSSLIAKDE